MCNLVTSHKVGKEVLFEVRPDQLAATASWMTTLATTWTERLHSLKQQAEGQAGDSTSSTSARRNGLATW